jgi:hypothetical protein
LSKARVRQSSSSKAKNVASETHQSIDEQVAAFLRSGKKIQKIPRGVSGQTNEPGGRRHIRISNKQKTG